MRKGQFFIITAVLIAGALLTVTTILTSAQSVDYNSVLERHDTEIVQNTVVVEAGEDYVDNGTVHVVLDARRSFVQDDCSDIRVIDGKQRAWENTTACNIDSYESETRAVGRWKLDRYDAGVNDSTGNEHDGTMVGDPEWISGFYGTGLEFEPAELVEVSGFPDLVDNITVTARIRTTDSGAGNNVVMDDRNDNGWSLSVGDAGAGIVSFSVSGVGTVTSSASVDDGEWHHITAVRNAETGEHRIYIDGELDSSATLSGSPTTDSGPLSIGEGFDGTIDDARVYNVTMSSSRVEGEALGGIGLNVSLDASPLERKAFHVYYGNPLSSDPSSAAPSGPEANLEVMEVGPVKVLDRFRQRVGSRVNRLDDRFGPSLDFFVGDDCSYLRLRSPQTALDREIC